jgi:uncharacterized surface protein with fasciclin (FAS1) repeats
MGANVDFIVNVSANGVSIIDNNLATNDANVTGTDKIGTNGVLHFLDAVMLPE